MAYLTSFANTKYPEDVQNGLSTMRHTGVGNLDLDRKKPRDKHGSFNQYHPDACEARFDTIDLMPPIASKFRRRDRTTIFKTLADRTDAAIIKPSEGGELSYLGNEKYVQPKIKGDAYFCLASERKTQIGPQ